MSKSPPSRPSRPIRFILHRVYPLRPDGTFASEAVDVAVERGVITWVRPASSDFPEGWTVVNAAGRLLLPGFVDMHTHLTRYPELFPWLFRFGITGIRETGTTFEAARNARVMSPHRRPKLALAGPLIDGDPPRWPALAYVVRTPDEVQEIVARHRAEGLEWVKAYHRLPPDLLRVLIREAHRADLRVTGHLGQVPWRTVIAWGINGLEHVRIGTVDGLIPRRLVVQVDTTRWPLKDFRFWACVHLRSDRLRKLLDAMAHAGVIWVPTLTVLAVAIVARAPGERRMPEEIQHRWSARSYRLRGPALKEARIAWPRILRLVHMAHKAGVRIGIGSDTPSVHIAPGWGFHWEMRWLERAGVSLSAILQMACWRPYEWLRWPRPMAPGSPADLVLIDPPFLQSVRDLRRIRAVWRSGHLVFTHRPRVFEL